MEHVSSPADAERNAAEKMRQLGFADARVIQAGADSGLDVISSDAVAQVKRESHQTGRPALQNLYGARGSRHNLVMLFFSASGYTRHAIEYANQVHICLFAYDIVGDINPVNGAARVLLHRHVKAQQEGTGLPHTET